MRRVPGTERLDLALHVRDRGCRLSQRRGGYYAAGGAADPARIAAIRETFTLRSGRPRAARLCLSAESRRSLIPALRAGAVVSPRGRLSFCPHCRLVSPW